MSEGDELEQRYVDLLIEVSAYLKFGGILNHHRNRVRAIGESIHDTLGFEYMQAFALDLRELFNVSKDSSWVGHPQELDFAWEGIGGWLP